MFLFNFDSVLYIVQIMLCLNLGICKDCSLSDVVPCEQLQWRNSHASILVGGFKPEK